MRSLYEVYDTVQLFENNLNGENESPEQCVNAILSLSIKPSVILINVDYRFPNYPKWSAGGLRLVELLRMETDLSVPILVYSWRSLQELRADPSLGFTLLIDSLELADAARNTLTKFIRLPVSSAELIEAISGLHEVHSKGRDRFKELQVARSLLENEMERLCRSIRHRYQNVLAAQRLLLGAYLAGDISFTSLSEAAGKIGNTDNALLSNLTVLREKWLRVEQELSGPPETHAQPQVSSDPFTGTILVVDDHYQADPNPSSLAGSIGDFGWSHVYQALFQTKHFQFKVIGVTSYDDAIKHFSVGSLSELTLIILDVDLGEPEKSGLHLLQQIRSRDPFIPVLVVTSFDDAEVCQTALELQADAFFAKQLSNEADRTSLDYYNSLVNTVRKILQDLNPDRKLYDCFARLQSTIRRNDESTREKGQFQGLGDGVLSELTKFFLLLRAIKRHHLARHLLINNRLQVQDGGFDELILVLLDAILAWPNWMTRPKEPRIESFEVWRQKTDIHRVPIANFFLDRQATVVGDLWTLEAAAFFGYDPHEISGIPFQELIATGTNYPTNTEIEKGWKGSVWFKKKPELFREQVLIEIEPLAGQFKVTILRYILPLILRAANWSATRHTQKSKVSLEDVRTLAGVFLDTISSTILSPHEEPSRWEKDLGSNESLPHLIKRARQRERSLIREHSIKSKMGSTAVLLGGYFASADATVPAPLVENIIDGFWTTGVDPQWNGEIVFSVLEEPSEEALLYLALKRERLSPLSVLIIDDHARSNGWAYVSQLIHHDAIVNNLEFRGAPGNAGFEDYVTTLASAAVQKADLVLLDLRMPADEGGEPSAETGLRVAEIIKRMDPLLPVMFLSAQNDAITMRNGIARGATDFFPKEAPYSRTVADMVDYFTQFSTLPEKFRFADEAWIEFSAYCRRAVFSLDMLAEHLSSAQPYTTLPPFLTTVLNEKILTSTLAQMLKVENSIQALHAAFVNQITALFRRAMFFVFLSRERYLSPWLSYFADAVPGMNVEMLGYDQVWIDCGMIVEFTFNVVARGRCRAPNPRSPGKRSIDEANALISLLGKREYERGMEIWRERNQRRYLNQSSAPTEEARARKLVESCILFLSEVGLIELTPPSKPATINLQSLRENLVKSAQRREITMQIAQQQKSVKASHKDLQLLPSEIDALASKAQQLKSAIEELRRLDSKTVLDERHHLLSHLLA